MLYDECLYNQLECLIKKYPEGLRIVRAEYGVNYAPNSFLEGCTYTFDCFSEDDITTLYKLATDYSFTLTFQDEHAVFSYNSDTASELDKDTVEQYLRQFTKGMIGLHSRSHIIERAQKLLPLNKLPDYVNIIADVYSECF